MDSFLVTHGLKAYQATNNNLDRENSVGELAHLQGFTQLIISHFLYFNKQDRKSYSMKLKGRSRICRDRLFNNIV